MEVPAGFQRSTVHRCIMGVTIIPPITIDDGDNNFSHFHFVILFSQYHSEELSLAHIGFYWVEKGHPYGVVHLGYKCAEASVLGTNYSMKLTLLFFLSWLCCCNYGH